MPSAMIADAAAEVGGVDEGGARGIELRHEGVSMPPARRGLEGPGVVGKSVELVSPSRRRCRRRPPRCRADVDALLPPR